MRLDTQHNRAAYSAYLEAAERGNGGAVLDRYAGYIRYFSKMNGYYNSDMEDYIKTKLIESLFKFRLDR